MARPLIGITTYREFAAWGTWRTDAHVLPAAYVESVRRRGHSATDPAARAG